jgi:hypothetical protein
VFTARYALSHYIRQIRFVFKWLKQAIAGVSGKHHYAGSRSDSEWDESERGISGEKTHALKFFLFFQLADCKDFHRMLREVCIRSTFFLYGLYFLEEQDETLRCRLNISPVKCITTTVLYVEGDCLLGYDAVWSDTELHGVTCHICALKVEVVGSSETLVRIIKLHEVFPRQLTMCACSDVALSCTTRMHAEVYVWSSYLTATCRFMLCSVRAGMSVLFMWVDSH